MSNRGGPRYSPDGHWWWSGVEWLPALSPDGQWRWTGWRWARRAWYERLARWFVRDLAIWLLLVTAWAPGIAVVVEVRASTLTLVLVGVVLGTIAVVAMLGFGAKLGRRSMWREVGLSCVAATAVLLGW